MVVMMVVVGLEVVIGSGGDGSGDGSFVEVVVIDGLNSSFHLGESHVRCRGNGAEGTRSGGYWWW